MLQRRFPTPHDWREGRRLRGWELAQQGWTQRAIAAALGAGPAGLRRRTSPGAPPKLAPAQWARVPALLARGPAAFGFRGDVWTAPRIAAVVATHFGVRYHPAQISRRL